MAESWKEERAQTLAGAGCLVVKVGSAVITGPEGLDLDVVRSLAKQMAKLARGPEGPRKLLLVSSAAVAAGRAVLAGHGTGIGEGAGLATKQGAAALGQARLMRAWDDAFSALGLMTAQVLLTQDDFRVKARLLNASNTFMELFSWGAVPVVNENDTVSVEGLRLGDNDSLASLLVTLVGAALLVNVTSSPGVYLRPPQPGESLPPVSCLEDVARLDLDRMCGAKTNVGTGGMRSKLLAARRAAQRGVPTIILPGREPEALTRAFAGEELGTWVRPKPHAISSRKFWLAYRATPQGSVDVDEGAADALLNRGKSLLPGGVVAVKGSFRKGDSICITHGKTLLGIGLSNYGAADLDRIKGLKRFEVAAILGNAHYPEVVHRDNLLLGAAL